MSSGAHKHKSIFPFPNDWKINTSVMDGMERVLTRARRVVRIYDVPYVAGYSRDGKTIYIDRLMPKGFVYKGKNIETDKYLVLHECVEKALLMFIKGLKYQFAHQIALRAEESAVASDGIHGPAYDDFMNKQIALIGARKEYLRCPPDLDHTPMVDEDDTATLDKMKKYAKAA